MNEIIKGSNTLLPNGYAQWRKDIEHLIDTAKLHTALNVNVGTLTLYWNIGNSIVQKQEQEGWGKQVIEQLSKDLISRYADSDIVRDAVKTTHLHKLVVMYRGAEMVVCEEIE